MSTQATTDRPGRGWTAIGRAAGPHRTWLVATCVALVLAAIADEATGYDGPGPFVYPAFALVVALVPGRFTPLSVVLMSAFFGYGGFASAESVRKLTTPAHVLDFTAGWVQQLSFAAAAAFAVLAVLRSRRPNS